jgi:hypothetical protein
MPDRMKGFAYLVGDKPHATILVCGARIATHRYYAAAPASAAVAGAGTVKAGKSCQQVRKTSKARKAGK